MKVKYRTMRNIATEIDFTNTAFSQILGSNISTCVYKETKCFKIEIKYSVRGKNLDLTYLVLQIYKEIQPMLIKGMEKYLV